MKETALPKCLKLVRDTGQLLTESEISTRIGEEQSYVGKALETLADKGVAIKIGEYYCYQKTPTNEKLCARLLAVYDKLTNKLETESIIIGLLDASKRHKYLWKKDTLIRLLEEEGYDDDQIVVLLGRYIKDRHVVKVKVAFRKPREDFVAPPPAISVYYAAQFVTLSEKEYERKKSMWRSEGFVLQEEEYLLSHFQKEMVAPGRDLLNERMLQVNDKMSSQAYERMVRDQMNWIGMSG